MPAMSNLQGVHMKKHHVAEVTFAVCLFLCGCQKPEVMHDIMDQPLTLRQVTAAEWDRLASRTIFFGHQSVGADILRGVRELMADHPEIRLRIVDGLSEPLGPAPALVQFPIGRNGDPHSKNEAFRVFFDNRPGIANGVALYKFCYLDVDHATDPGRLFDDYNASINRLKATHSGLQIVHVTSPLTTVESPVKLALKTLLGRSTDRELNVIRNEYNRLLRREFGGKDPIYDLARIESTREDGSRVFFVRDNQAVYGLAPELTSDGGHLNQTGRRAAAEQFLILLAKLR